MMIEIVVAFFIVIFIASFFFEAIAGLFKLFLPKEIIKVINDVINFLGVISGAVLGWFIGGLIGDGNLANIIGAIVGFLIFLGLANNDKVGN